MDYDEFLAQIVEPITLGDIAEAAAYLISCPPETLVDPSLASGAGRP